MDEDDFLRLEKLVRENNEILKELRRAMRVKRFFGILYWVFFIALALGAYYFVEPFITPIRTLFESIISNVGNLGPALESVPRDIPGVIEKIQSG